MSKKYSPDAAHIYFVFDPLDSMVFFDNEEERDGYADEAIHAHCDDGWSEEVTDVIAGTVTHVATKCEVQLRSDSPDEWWHGDDVDEVCNYKMSPLKHEEPHS